MGLFQSLTVGVSGVQSQSNKIGVLSDNIANVNTVGYKGSDAQFRTLVNGSLNPSAYSPGGAQALNRQLIQKQGLLTGTDSSTDLAISGSGFFAVSNSSVNGGSLVYTRAGAFTKDETGNYANTAGYFLKGWLLDINGNLPPELATPTVAQGTAEVALQTVNVDRLSAIAVPTSLITLRANLKSSQIVQPNNSVNFIGNLISTQPALPTTSVAVKANVKSSETALSPLAAYDPLNGTRNMASGAIAPTLKVPLTVYDPTGAARTLNAGFIKTAANTWAVEIYAENVADITPATGFPAGLVASGTATFNPDGTLATLSPALTAATTIDWNTPTTSGAITFDFGTVGLSDGLQETTAAYSSTSTARPNYDPTVATSSMSAGTTVPHYSTLVTVTDNTGVARDVNIHFVKTAANTWGIEVTAAPVTDITTPVGGVPGQIAYGTATFNADGSLASISPALTNALSPNWVGTTEANSLVLNWGVIGGTNGLTQLSTAFTSAPVIVENYDPTDATKNMSSGLVQSHYNRAIDVVDSGGVLRTLNFTFLKTNINTWAVEVAVKNSADVSTPTAQIAHGMVTFNGDGTLASITPSLSTPVTVNWSNGVPTTIALTLGTAGPVAGTPGATVVGLNDGLTQFESPYQVKAVSQNGSVAGEVAAVTVDENGFVIGTYQNGAVRRLYKIPLAEFTSENRLDTLNSNVFAWNRDSGAPVYAQAGRGGQGIISGNALEASNVELSAELTDIIIAQRAYQSNTRLITTSDELLQNLTQMGA